MGTTLILNADGQPLSVVPLSVMSWQDAVSATWSGDVTVVEEYNNQDKHSPSVTIALPSVVMLREYHHIKKGVKFSRYNVFLRDSFTCQYCGLDMSHNQNMVTLDHYHPRAKGGKTTWENSIAACPNCNTEKAHYNHMEPRYKPYKPDYWDLMKKRKQLPLVVPHESWIQYLAWGDGEITVKPPK